MEETREWKIGDQLTAEWCNDIERRLKRLEAIAKPPEGQKLTSLFGHPLRDVAIIREKMS